MRANQEIFQKTTASVIDSTNLDESIYDYDGQYDSFKREAERTSKVSSAPFLNNPAANTNQDSKYISNLKSMAKLREREREKQYERRLLKEQQEEAKEVGDKEKFITSAYKAKLMEDEKWKYEEK
jgi:coiled-coil domain-containing protein 55